VRDLGLVVNTVIYKKMDCKVTLFGNISHFLEKKKIMGRELYKRKQHKIPSSFFIDTQGGGEDHADETDRNVRRYRQKAKRLMLNVASGVFPGNY